MNKEINTSFIPVRQKLRVVHMPQVPGECFYIDVDNEVEAARIVQILALQHQWLYVNNFIPDYSNIITVEMLNSDTEEWETYVNEEMEYAEWEEVEELLKDKVLSLNLRQNF